MKNIDLPVSAIERELLDALERLKSGSPQKVELVRKIKLGTLRITPTSVAFEAGRSRTLISHKKCAYPKVRMAILELAHPVSEPRSQADINRRLRQENAELKLQLKAAREQMAAMLRRMARIELDAKREVAAAQRREQRGLKNSNELVGSALARESSSVVVDISGRPLHDPSKK